MNTEHRQQKISFWHSMKTQFIAVVILVAAVIVILYTLMIMPGVKSNIRSIYSNYLLDLSISYGREMESAMQVNIDLLDNPEAAQDILQQLDVAGAKTAYAYLVGFARIRIWQSARCSLFISSAYSTSTVISFSFSLTSTR